MSGCFICDENARHDAGTAVGIVATTATGYVRLNRVQRYRGAAFFCAREHVREVYDLDEPVRSAHLAEMALVAEALDEVFSPAKMNVESLGNSVPHLHWWLTPRYADDADPLAPIWVDEAFRAMPPDGGPADPEGFASDTEALRAALVARGVVAG
jgi:diadenosine tetraphosphate (Ap4A) HIT family hydrolase